MILACVRLACTGNVSLPVTSSSCSSPTRRPAAARGRTSSSRQHPEVFEGVTEAISEVGGYSVTVTDRDGTERRTYLLQTAEKGTRGCG